MKSIIISRKNADDTNTPMKGYLVKDMDTKFIVLNEAKKLTLHFPKSAYTYKEVTL